MADVSQSAAHRRADGIDGAEAGDTPLEFVDLHELGDPAAVAKQLAAWHAAEFSGRTQEERTATYLRPAIATVVTAGEEGGEEVAPRLPVTIVAVLDGAVVGSVALVVDDMPGRDCKCTGVPPGRLTPWLGALFVSPDSRRRGVGRALVREAMRRIAAAGVARLYLWTPVRRLADSWYPSLGWAAIGRQHDYRGYSEVFVMKAELDDASTPTHIGARV